jgi:hypothetical protein
MFFAASPRLLVVARRLGNGMPRTFLFLLRVRAIPVATPAMPAPAAITGVLSLLAAAVTASAAVFAPLAVASFAASTAPFFDELAFVRLEDPLARVLLCDALAFFERRPLERDFAAVRPFAGDLRLVDVFPELALGLFLVCWAMEKA